MAENKDILKASIMQAFGTLVVREFFLKLLSFAGQIFLARLLVPSDFGIYVIIIFIIGFFGLFSDVGLSLAIIQKKEEPTKIELSEVFMLKVLLSLGLILLIWILAPYARLFYTTFSDANVMMLRVFSITLLLASLRAVPISLLERKIKYNLISLLDIAGVFVYYVVALTGAFLNFGVWSFILGAVIKEISETVILYIIQPFLPNITLSLGNIKKMLRFGIYMQGNGLVNFLRSSIVPVIGGIISGPYGVGLLHFSFNIALLPETVASNFGRVAFAGYSRIQSQRELLASSISRSVSMLSIIIYLFPVIIFSFGSVLIPIVFSEKWAPALPALYWYSAGAFFLPMLASLGQGILAIGKSKEIFWGSFLTAVSGWIIALSLINIFGFVAIAVTYFLTSFFFCMFYIIILKKSGFELNIISVLAPKIIAVVFSFAFSLGLNFLLPQGFFMIIIKLFLSVTSYFIFMLIFVRKDTKELFSLIANWIKFK